MSLYCQDFRRGRCIGMDFSAKNMGAHMDTRFCFFCKKGIKSTRGNLDFAMQKSFNMNHGLSELLFYKDASTTFGVAEVPSTPFIMSLHYFPSKKVSGSSATRQNGFSSVVSPGWFQTFGESLILQVRSSSHSSKCQEDLLRSSL